MRQILFLLVSAMLLSFSAEAQKPTFGFKAGLNMAKWKPGQKSSSYDIDFRNGLLMGFHADLPVSGPVSVQPELLYGMFGSVFTKPNDKAVYKTGYMLLPVLANYHLDNGLSFQLGPQLGFLMSAKSKLDGETYDFKDDMKKTDVFMVMGGEYAFKNGLSAGFRYQHGLTNVETGANTTLKNRAITLYAAYRFCPEFEEMLHGIFN